jgi:hypothetical protein
VEETVVQHASLWPPALHAGNRLPLDSYRYRGE